MSRRRVAMACRWPLTIVLMAGGLIAGCGDRHWRYPKADVVLVVIDTLRADGLWS